MAIIFAAATAALCRRCVGRSYNCLRWLQETLASYELLCAVAYNVHLPRLVRAAAVDLVRLL